MFDSSGLNVYAMTTLNAIVKFMQQLGDIYVMFSIIHKNETSMPVDYVQ